MLTIQKIEGRKAEEATRKATYKQALLDAKAKGREAYEAEKNRITQEKLAIAEEKRQEKLRQAAAKQAEKSRIAASKVRP